MGPMGFIRPIGPMGPHGPMEVYGLIFCWSDYVGSAGLFRTPTYIWEIIGYFSDLALWALGVFNIGQKGGGRPTKILPARQTHFWELFGQPVGKNTFSRKDAHTPPKCYVNENFKFSK